MHSRGTYLYSQWLLQLKLLEGAKVRTIPPENEGVVRLLLLLLLLLLFVFVFAFVLVFFLFLLAVPNNHRSLGGRATDHGGGGTAGKGRGRLGLVIVIVVSRGLRAMLAELPANRRQNAHNKELTPGGVTLQTSTNHPISNGRGGSFSTRGDNIPGGCC
jgi:hypothetical protein